MSRNKTDRLDAALIARFCRSHNPPASTPPAADMRELREMVRRCAALKANRTQEINRQKAGFASAVVAASIQRLIGHIDDELRALTAQIRALIASHKALQTNFDLVLSIPRIGEVTAALVLAELPNIAEFTPKALAAFAGLSSQGHSSGTRHHAGGISRIGHAALRSVLYLCALSARRYDPVLLEFSKRLSQAGKPPKVALISIARKLRITVHAVIRTQQPFNPKHEPLAPAAA